MNKTALYLLAFLGFMALLIGSAFWRQHLKRPLPQAETTVEVTAEVADAVPPQPEDDPAFFLQEIDLDAPTERALAVQECGTCHPDVYANWKDGPHGNAYHEMRKGYDQIQDEDLHPREYARWLTENFRICYSCHASKNIYETHYPGIENQADVLEINHYNYPKLFALAEPRTDPETWSTGVDCFTCHYNGERILTGPNFKADPQKAAMEGYCDPLPSPFFNSNTSCRSCHAIHVDHLMNFTGNGLVSELETNETNCIKCHQEYDSHGKGTHYFYWRHDDPEKHPRKEVKGGIFEALKLKVRSGKTLVVDWSNTLYPHNFSECGEILVLLTVHDAVGDSIFGVDIRLNRKEYHDPMLREHMFGAEPTGSPGYSFNPGQAPLHKEFDLPYPIQRGTVSIRAYDKIQYWAKDEAGALIYEDTRRI